jgi:hypothetical protein
LNFKQSILVHTMPPKSTKHHKQATKSSRKRAGSDSNQRTSKKKKRQSSPTPEPTPAESQDEAAITISESEDEEDEQAQLGEPRSTPVDLDQSRSCSQNDYQKGGSHRSMPFTSPLPILNMLMAVAAMSSRVSEGPANTNVVGF